MPLDLSALRAAIATLDEALTFAHSPLMAQFTAAQCQTVQAGVIQCFECAYEQAWKMMKRWLEHNLGSVYVDGVTRRTLFRLAAEHQLIDDVTVWFGYHTARNQTTHTYALQTATAVLQVIPAFLEDALGLLHQLQQKND
jgi:nucleotidyltransferase substrate binding protein (TIGR01987 family)